LDSRYVVVGFGATLLGELDGVLPARSVVVLEDPDVIRGRNVRERIRANACVGELVEVPVQVEDDEVDAVVESVQRPDRVRAVLPGLEYGTVLAAALAESWGLPGATTDAARVLRDKHLLRQRAGSAGIPQPEWELVDDARSLAAFGSRHPGGYVVKPTVFQASVGVEILFEGDDVDAAWARAGAARERGFRAPTATQPQFLAERRLVGPELSVEAFVSAATVVFANVTQKRVTHVSRSRHPVEAGHLVPAPVPDALRARLVAATTRLVAATGFHDGVVHAEWIVEDGEPSLVECAGRSPGDLIPHLIDRAYGTRFAAVLVAVLSGDDVEIGPAVRGSAITFLQGSPGVLTSVGGVDEARAVPGVVDLHVDAVVGDRLSEVVSSWQRVGYVVAVGDTAAQAERAAQHAEDLLVLTVDTA